MQRRQTPRSRLCLLLTPVLWWSGNSDARAAESAEAPMVGGVLFAMLLTLIVIPDNGRVGLSARRDTLPLSPPAHCSRIFSGTAGSPGHAGHDGKGQVAGHDGGDAAAP